MKLKILIADDHGIVREGLRALLEKEADMVVVAEAENGSAAVQRAREHRPDVVLMDISMPEMNGIDATRQLRAELGDIRILALSMETDRRFVVEVLKAGANGYLLKDCAFAEMAAAIRAVARDETYLPPKITELVIKEYLQRVPAHLADSQETLTAREREILQLIAAGKNTKEIAYIVGVSVKTVENQRQAIMKKLDLYSIAELTRYAVRQGLSSL